MKKRSQQLKQTKDLKYKKKSFSVKKNIPIELIYQFILLQNVINCRLYWKNKNILFLLQAFFCQYFNLGCRESTIFLSRHLSWGKSTLPNCLLTSFILAEETDVLEEKKHLFLSAQNPRQRIHRQTGIKNLILFRLRQVRGEPWGILIYKKEM